MASKVKEVICRQFGRSGAAHAQPKVESKGADLGRTVAPSPPVELRYVTRGIIEEYRKEYTLSRQRIEVRETDEMQNERQYLIVRILSKGQGRKKPS